MGARLLLGEDKKDVFDAQVAFEIACKVSPCRLMLVRTSVSLLLLVNEQLV